MRVHLSFKLRTTLLIGAVTLLILVLVLWRATQLYANANNRTFSTHARQVVQMYAIHAEEGLMSNDTATLDAQTNEIFKIDNVVFARVIDADDRTVTEKSLLETLDADADRAALLTLTSDIVHGGHRFGRVTMTFDPTSTHKETRKAIYSLVFFSFMGLVFVMMVAFGAAHLIALPLRTLIGEARLIAAGELGRKFPVRGADEIAQLTNTLNVVSSQLADFFTKSNKQQLELNLAANWNKAIIDIVMDAIITIDENGIISECNTSTENIFGYARNELIGNNVSLLMEAPHRGRHDEYVRNSMDTSKRNVFGIRRELNARHKSGRVFTIELAVNPIINSDNKRFFVGVARDIEAKKKAERELQRTRDEALTAANAKAMFLATMSHEIRTPIHGVLGMLGLLEKTPLSPKQAHFASTATRSAKSLLAIIDDVLDFSKLEAGKFTLDDVDFEPRQLLEDLAGVLRLRASEKGVLLEVDVAAQVPEVIRGDPQRLRQILTNLIGNAIKFTDQGTVHVSIGLEKNSSGAAKLRCTIADTGIGIAPDVVKTLFSPFNQADSSTSRRFGGTGLGLAICKQLANLMGGEIGVDSQLGAGSTFWFTVEFRSGDKRNVQKFFSETVEIALSGRVLIAEDNPVNLEYAEALLHTFGLEVDTACDGREALQMVERHPYDAILMDGQMPIIDGYEATRRIRAREKELNLPHVPVLALTANAMREDREKCLAAGMDDYLSKPYSEAALAQKLAALLKQTLNTSSIEELVTTTNDSEVDLQKLLAMQRTFGQHFDTMLEKFVENSAKLIERAEAAARQFDANIVKQSAHSLKGSSGTVGALAISTDAKSIEAMAERGEFEQIQHTIDDLRRHYAEFLDAIEHLRRA